ncbi:MAG TPA: hypothetical protein VJK04_01865 [Candidatus Paceibacterota bacterium]
MKDVFHGNSRLGFSSIEILIATTVLVVVLSAVVLVSFGNQSLLIDSETSSEALTKAQELIEQEQALARKDFKLVNPVSLSDGIYQKKIDITMPDFFTKKVTATVSWVGDPNRSLNVSLSALVTNFENTIGGDTCSSALTGNWSAPQKIGNQDYTFGADLINDTAGIYPITDLDAYKGKLYAVVNNQSVNVNQTFFVFDISNQNVTPVFLGGVDNATGVAAGLNAVTVAENTVTGKIYAYVANGYGANFATCTQGAKCAQFQVIDVSTPVSLSVVSSYNLKTLGMVTGAGGQAVGNSIFYSNGYIYLGLTKTASGPEFNIIDVRNPSSPKWVGGYVVGNDVNAIYVKSNKYAYLATPNAQELIILDVSDPTHPTPVGGFNSMDGAGNGKSVFVVGDRLYLGKTVPNAGNDFHILDNTLPSAILPELTTLGATDFGSSINGLIVRDYLSFLLTNSELNILRTDNASAIGAYASMSLTSANQGRSLDCEGNYLYAGYINASSTGYVTVITAP